MEYDSDAADSLAVALVMAMIDRSDLEFGGNGRRHAMRVADMVRELRLGEVDTDQYVGALGSLAARAVEDLASATGEPTALWMARWLGKPYGSV